ncbi:MAG TPA: M48 family metalloprotease [Cellvibrionaceae bacterium]
MKHYKRGCILLILLLISQLATPRDALNLPDFGDASSLMISPQEEQRLGQLFLSSYRGQMPTSSDPLLLDYINSLLANLAQHSQLINRNLHLVVVESPVMNAFAAPGNIVGVNTGLLVHSQSETQLVSVLSHELAHLSQRHYARRLEQQKNMQLPMVAALLASLALLATDGGDGGIAALTASQALAADAQLRFSRHFEQEADRLGMDIMINAGYDPYGAAEMFEQMLRASRFYRRPPEFLLTHPVTESRVADARNRAQRFDRRLREDNVEYHLMRNRIRFDQAGTSAEAISMFSGEIAGKSLSVDASRYGLALAYSEAGRIEEARNTLAPLLANDPERITYKIMDIDIDIRARDYDSALAKLQSARRYRPNNYPLNVRYAETLMASGRHQTATDFLSQYVRERPNDPHLWYLLAEVSGLAGNILQVHEARAEYFILLGSYSMAITQLRHALKLSTDSFHRTALLTERLRHVEELQIEIRNL